MRSRNMLPIDLPPLVMRCGAFGDMVLLTVLLRQLHARFGRPADVISSGPWTAPLLSGHPAVGNLYLIRSRRMPYWLSSDQQTLVARLRHRGAGPTWFCDQGVGRSLLRRAGIPDDYVCDARNISWIPHEHVADRYIRLSAEGPNGLAGRLPAAKPSALRAAEITVQPEAHAELDEWLDRRMLRGRPLVVIHPGCRHLARRWLRSPQGVSKYWPVARWALLVQAIRASKPDHAIILSGTGAEGRMISDIEHLAGVRGVYGAAGELPIPTLLALLQRAESTVSVDTGPAHAAAALGCPTVALFGTADAQIFRPGGVTTPAVSLTGVVDGRQSILGISAQTAIDAWINLPARTTAEPVPLVANS